MIERSLFTTLFAAKAYKCAYPEWFYWDLFNAFFAFVKYDLFTQQCSHK